MKKFPVVLILLMAFLAVVVTYTPARAVTEKVILQVEGITCIVCPSVIKTALEQLDGVEKAKISFQAQKGEVFFDPDKVSQFEIVNKVNQIGFKAMVIEEEPSRVLCRRPKLTGRATDGS